MPKIIPGPKHRVTLYRIENGQTHEATDLVPAAILDVYVADARTRWQHVLVDPAPVTGPEADLESVCPPHLVGKTVDDFAQYGDWKTPDNALMEA